MKVAVPSNDGKTIAEHFGRAQSFILFEVEEGVIKSRQLADSQSPHHQGQHGNHQGPWFMPSLQGTDIIISRGMGRKAIAYFEQEGIKPVFTDLSDAEQVVIAYSQGNLQECSRPDCGHH